MSQHHTGDRVSLPEGAIPSDWSHTGEIEEVRGETVVVRLDSGQLQELPDDEVIGEHGRRTGRWS